jgi:hypothetical protein
MSNRLGIPPQKIADVKAAQSTLFQGFAEVIIKELFRGDNPEQLSL